IPASCVETTGNAGIPEMVVPGLTGELVAPGDPEAFASALEKIISDPQLAREMGEHGRDVAKEKFSIEANVRDLAQILGRSRADL
ncbi:MAG TPA: glycosyltransferase, partial [Chthoniobacterales bacterium]|nr:glycosyltransferase [Chthoniobacterales bacterium]